MILHLLFDSQFSDYVIDQFQGKEMCSDVVLISNTNQMLYFHRVDAVRIVNPFIETEMNQLLKDIATYNAVIFHGFFYAWQEWLLNHWPEHVKVAWVCWGGEVYGQPNIRVSFLKPISQIIDRIHNIKHLKFCAKVQNKSETHNKTYNIFQESFRIEQNRVL